MTDHIIEGYTRVSGIAIFSFSPDVPSLVVDTRRDSSVREDICIHDLIELECGYPSLHIGSYHIERTSCEISSLSDSGDLFGSFDDYF